jgi:Tfp pilus assembly protein PilV
MTDGETESKEPDITDTATPEVDLEIEKPQPAAALAEPGREAPEVGDADAKSARRQVAISIRGLVLTALIAALVVGMGVLGWLYWGAERKSEAQSRQSADTAHAETVALDYAVRAAAMNAQDLAAWKGKLVAGTSPELKDKLSKAADQMEQILVPLQWNSSAQPLVAKVRSHDGSAYVVDSFVSVLTKTAQGPDPLQSTATYSVTVDSSKNWQITDVGGIGSAMQGK